MNKQWNDKDIQILKDNYGKVDAETLAVMLKTTKSSVHQKMFKLGLKVNRKIVIGQEYGELTPLNISTRRGANNEIYYDCKCSCGNFKEMRGSSLGKDLTCGHSKRGNPGDASFNHKERLLEIQARQRGKEHNLTREQFRYIIQQECFHCRKEPKLYNQYHDENGILTETQENRITKETAKLADIYINGIDRFDNDKGYIYSNSVPCCESCNRAKSEYTAEEFYNNSLQVTLTNMIEEDMEKIFNNERFQMFLKKKGVLI